MSRSHSKQRGLAVIHGHGYRTWLAAVLVAMLSAATAARAVTIDWVTVGNPGNTADTTGYGAVNYVYAIGKYEFTYGQYTAFLNAVDPDGTNESALYNQLPGYAPFSSSMGSVAWGGISFTSSNAAGSKYATLPYKADKPVTSVTWFNAARVANWLQKGGQAYGSSALGSAAIDDGAYTLGGATSGSAPARNTGAAFWIPSEDEWYKAAYYKGGAANAGYWAYASQSYSLTPVFATSEGIGTRDGMTPVTAAGYGNYNYGAMWNLQPNNFDASFVVSVGTAGGPSASGTYEQSGNACEWTSVGFSGNSSAAVWGGGYTTGDNTAASNSRTTAGPSGNTTWWGFRLATTGSAPVPEIDPAGLASAMALITGALCCLERRRRSSMPSAANRAGLGIALAAVMALAPRAQAVTIDWVTVGDPGNAADTNPAGYGVVADTFRIMKYEWTNSQYVEFLNTVDPNGTNPNAIYNALMGSDGRGGISFTGGNALGTKYAARPNMGDKPVIYVSWFDAARVANWLMNGAASSSSTESGAYTLVGGQTSGPAPARNPGATFSIPTENQWYKAAYYKGGNTNAGYWDYATQSDFAPGVVTAGSTGIGSAGSTGNFANYYLVADWNGQDGNVTTVGTNGGPSAYGAFDMSGNVQEWNDLTGAAGSSRGLRGGKWNYNEISLSSSDRGAIDAWGANSDIGFRLASPVSAPSGVPEIDPAGARLVAGLIVCALALLEQRRHGR